mmetsp:Transcript_60412/g.124240  ORF Transcript_60412/g.124240 Transcript_60412/m.124240 type:complete len:274 (+) Transcript_60412:967-1788(+)
MLSTATPLSCKPWTRRSLSEAARAVAMVTTMNCVVASSVSSSRSSIALSRCRCSAAAASSMSSRPSSPEAKLLSPKSVLAALMAPSNFLLMLITFCRKESRKSGKESSRSVCPVGAVSTMTRSKPESLTSVRTFPSATTSSMPGGGFSSRSANSSSPIFAASSPSLLFILDTPLSFSLKLSSAFSVSTSIAKRFPSVPSTTVGSPFNCMPRQSPRECAGSVEITNVLIPSSASFTPRALLVLVLPTPPLPPTKTNWLLHSGSKSFPYCPSSVF